GMLEMLGRLQQRLGRDAAHVGAGAAGRGAALVVGPGVDAGNRLPKLGGANGGDVAAGARADHDDVKLFGHVVLSIMNGEGCMPGCGAALWARTAARKAYGPAHAAARRRTPPGPGHMKA